MDFNMALFEQTINEILPGLTMYVRDVNLPDRLSGRYIPGTLILERGFTDASSRVMGMKTTHRFAILSNHMRDLSAYEHGTNWGLFVAASSSHFLILDKYEYHGKTQIILLHLPNDKRWKLFQNVKINVLDDVVKDTRKRFENKCEQEVVPELATNEWIDRCSAPLGMDDDGNLFDLDVLLDRRFRKVGETDFRALYHQIIYVNPSSELQLILRQHFSEIADDDGVLAYGYIDEQAGFSFRLLCSANIRNNRLSRGRFIGDTFMIVRRAQMNDCNYTDLDYCDIDTSDFEAALQSINENYKCKNEQTEKMRSFAFLDGVRSVEFPDDIQIVLFQKGMQPEQVWVKCWSFTDNELYGMLLNEPNQDFGVHYGSIIGFAPIKQENGILCVYNGKILDKQGNK